MLEQLILLDGATNDRLQGELYGLAGIGPFELVYGIPHAQIVNAAFTHAHEHGSRFSDGTRGAWYAADELDTSVAEVIYHKQRRLAEIIVPELPWQRPDHETSTFDDWLADFNGEFHVLTATKAFARYLKPEVVPACYAEPQTLARQLLSEHRSNGIVYPSVRRKGHRCLVCFRPALVHRPRPGVRLEIRFRAIATGYEHRVRRVSRS